MSKRFIITAINKEGEQKNIFKDQRSFKNKRSTEKHIEYFITYFHAKNVEVEEIEVETNEDKLVFIKSQLEILLKKLEHIKDEK